MKLPPGKCLGGLPEFARAFWPLPKILVIGAGQSALWVKRMRGLREYTTITVNSAGELLKSDLWMAFDLSCYKWPWWTTAAADFHLVGRSLAERAGRDAMLPPWDWFEFEHIRTIHPAGRDKFHPWCLYGGATISGCALLLALSFPTTKEVLLTGCDFMTNRQGQFSGHYYDADSPPESYAPDAIARSRTKDRWKKMDWILRQFRKRGIPLRHLGPTSLECEIVFPKK